MNSIRQDYSQDCESLRGIHESWDAREKMIVSKPGDRLSATQKSQVSDGGLSTMVMERAFRVMGQLPTGVVKAVGLKDKGKALLMDLIIQRHVIPNANWGTQYLTKLRQWDFYSQVYGIMAMLYDWKVRDDGYIGPDCRLIPIRDFTPQRGRTSIADCDYVYIDTYHSVRDLEKELESKDSQWNKEELRAVLAQAKEGTVDKEYTKMSAIEMARSQYIGAGSARGDAARIRLVTKYWSGKDGKWETFAPDYNDEILRSIKNPHGTGRIPVVLKQSFPLVDSIYGLGDFERGESLQKAGDALTNLYFDAVKMSVYRPMIINPNGVVPHTLKYQAGAKWLETIPNSIRSFETSPQGMNTFQSTIGFIKGALNNQSGTTDTMITSETSSDPAFGKTPAALEKQQARENSRDNWDRFFMEQAVEELLEGFCCMIAAKKNTPIELTLWAEEIQQILALYPEAKDLIEMSQSGGQAVMTLSTKDLDGVDYRYYVDPGSTKAKDDSAQNEALVNAFGLFSKIPNLDQALAAQGNQVDYGKMFELILRTAGVEDISSILRKVQPGEGTGLGQSADAQGDKQPPVKPPIENINYKDAPPDIRRQMEAQAGLQPSQHPEASPMAPEVAPEPVAPEAPKTPSVAVHGHHFTDPHIVAAAKAMFGDNDGNPSPVELPAV
jgi:hypothetical protein